MFMRQENEIGWAVTRRELERVDVYESFGRSNPKGIVAEPGAPVFHVLDFPSHGLEETAIFPDDDPQLSGSDFDGDRSFDHDVTIQGQGNRIPSGRNTRCAQWQHGTMVRRALPRPR